jgi:hypothetical protein
MNVQAKDIPEDAFLTAIDTVMDLRDEWGCPCRNSGASLSDITAVLAGHPEHVASMWVDYPDMPWKVVLAKAKSLIRRGLVDGCACGCRGDFTRVEEVSGEPVTTGETPKRWWPDFLRPELTMGTPVTPFEYLPFVDAPSRVPVALRRPIAPDTPPDRPERNGKP